MEQAITNSQRGSELSRELKGGLEHLVTVVRGLGSAVKEIAEGSGKQSSGIADVSNVVGKMSSLGRANAGEAESTAAASQELSAQAEVLNDVSGELGTIFEGRQRKAAKSVRQLEPTVVRHRPAA